MHNALAIYIFKTVFLAITLTPKFSNQRAVTSPLIPGSRLLTWHCQGGPARGSIRKMVTLLACSGQLGTKVGVGGVTPHMVVVLLSFTGLTSHLGLFLFCLKFSTLSVSCSQHFSQVEVSKVESLKYVSPSYQKHTPKTKKMLILLPYGLSGVKV